jgi:hypothetical protein
MNRIPASGLHTKQLPKLNKSLDEALACSSANVSPWQKPVDWVRADSEYINYVIQDIAALTESEEIKQANFTDQLVIFPVS